MLSTDQTRLALALFDLGAVEFGEFRLAHHDTRPEAPPSPIYFNLRTFSNPGKPGKLTGEIIEEIGHAFYDLTVRQDLQYDLVAGIPNAGEPLAEAMVPKTQLLQVVKGKTREFVIVVPLAGIAGERILLIDDLITEATSKFKVIEAIEAQGGVVKDVLVLIDRQQGGARQLEEAGYCLHAVLPLDELLATYVSSGRIDETMAEKVLDYVTSS